jgi:hypothetical protein
MKTIWLKRYSVSTLSSLLTILALVLSIYYVEQHTLQVATIVIGSCLGILLAKVLQFLSDNYWYELDADFYNELADNVHKLTPPGFVPAVDYDILLPSNFVLKLEDRKAKLVKKIKFNSVKEYTVGVAPFLLKQDKVYLDLRVSLTVDCYKNVTLSINSENCKLGTYSQKQRSCTLHIYICVGHFQESVLSTVRSMCVKRLNSIYADSYTTLNKV